MSTYLIGDVQGCFAPLQRLLEQLRYDPASDVLAFAGDVVNRGADSLKTLRFVQSLGERAICVLGNHDLHLLARAHGGRRGRRDTLDELLSAEDRDALLDWLRQRPLLHEWPGWAMLHAGLPPQWDLDQARQAAREVEALLRGPDWIAMLAQMYGDQPAQWRADLVGIDRVRFAINAFTRLRYCDPDGRFDFAAKGPPGSQPAHLLPWFAIKGRRSRDTDIVFGHWSSLGRVHWPEHRVWGLDTGAVWGGRLTALCLETRQLTRVECPEYRREDGDSAD